MGGSQSAFLAELDREIIAASSDVAAEAYGQMWEEIYQILLN